MSLPSDKRGHLVVGALLAALLTIVVGVPAACAHGRLGFLLFLVIALLFIVIVAVAKEMLDLRDPQHHTCDPWDAVATIAGGLLVLIPTLIIALMKG